jgi:hypothetical protein
VHAQRNTSFFPDIYNDDWFFLLDGKRGLQPVAAAGQVTQEPYDPFRTPDRARAEELGDVLAEGLYWLLDQGGSVADADREHWEAFLANRKQFIERVISMMMSSEIEIAEKKRREFALKGSLDSLSLITPRLCQMYLQAWTDDRERWQEHLDRVPKATSRRQALNWLTIDGSPWPKAQRPERASKDSPCENPVHAGATARPRRMRALPAAALLSVLLTAATAGWSGGRRLWSAAGQDRGRIRRSRSRTRQ